MVHSRDERVVKREPGPLIEDEEFSEKIYELEAPVAPQFDEPHTVSCTGGMLHPEHLLDVDVSPPEEQLGV